MSSTLNTTVIITARMKKNFRKMNKQSNTSRNTWTNFVWSKIRWLLPAREDSKTSRRWLMISRKRLITRHRKSLKSLWKTRMKDLKAANSVSKPMKASYWTDVRRSGSNLTRRGSRNSKRIGHQLTNGTNSSRKTSPRNSTGTVLLSSQTTPTLSTWISCKTHTSTDKEIHQT